MKIDDHWRKWVAENIVAGCCTEQLKKVLIDNGIEALEACTLVLLSTSQF